MCLLIWTNTQKYANVYIRPKTNMEHYPNSPSHEPESFMLPQDDESLSFSTLENKEAEDAAQQDQLEIEQTVEREPNVEALRHSFESYAVRRGTALNTEPVDREDGRALVAPFTEDLDSISDGEKSERFTKGTAEIEANYSLIERIGPSAENEEESDCTVCIPVALLHEDISTVVNTVGLIKRAQQASGKPVDVVLWTNARYNEYNKDEIQAAASEKYDALKTELATYTDEGLRVDMALQTLDANDTAISKIRANSMDAIAMQAIVKGQGYEHPVVWLDADTTFMAKSALSELSDEVRSFDSAFAHANLQWSTEWAKGPLAEQDDATKAVALNEIHRRQLARMTEDGRTSGYVEEMGLAFAVGTYLQSGGVNTLTPKDESKWLMVQARPNGALRRPEFTGDSERMQKLKNLPAARIGTSARGFYDKV
jgi:hypothetical protein